MAFIERVGSGRILMGTAGTLAITVYVDGVATDPSVAAVSVVDGMGSAVTVGAAAIGGGLTGQVTASLDDAQTSTVRLLTATWTLTVGGNSQTFTTTHEVVGDVLFTEAELRAFDGGAVANVMAHSSAAVNHMHELVRESFEQICGTAFGARFQRDILDGTGTDTVWLSRMRVNTVFGAAVRAASSQTWTALTSGELASMWVTPGGKLSRDGADVWPCRPQSVRVDYSYGYQPVPLEIRRAAMWVARDYLAGSNIPNNAISQLDELGTFRLAVPGERGSWFGVPEVDRVLRDYRSRNHVPVVA